MEILNTIFFYIISMITIFCALATVFSPRIMYSALFAIAVFMSVSGFYFLLNAPFNAAVQIAIYGVGVTLLIVFAVMLTNYKQDKQIGFAIKPRSLFALASTGLIFLIVLIFAHEDFSAMILGVFKEYSHANIPQEAVDTTQALSIGLFQNYILAFELLSVLLLIALVGIGIVCNYKSQEDK